MHLRSVVGGMVASGDQCKLAVSTIGGKGKHDIRLESTVLERFSANDAVECVRQYQRWRMAVQQASVAQRTNAPGQSLRASFGMQRSDGVAHAYGHILDASLRTLERNYPETSAVLDQIRALAVRDIYAALKETIGIETALPEYGMTPADFTMPFFNIVDRPGIDTGKAEPLPPPVQYLLTRAQGYDMKALAQLRLHMQECGYKWAESQTKHLLSDTRFVRILKSSSYIFQIIDLFDFRAHFAKGIFEKTGWTQHLSMKFFEDPSSPFFVDIGITNLADQMNTLYGETENCLVALKI